MSESLIGGKVTTFTYEQARSNIDRVATAILHKIGSGGYVALSGKNSVEWILLFWAILKSGNKPYLVNLRQPAEYNASVYGVLGIGHTIFVKKPDSISDGDLYFDQLLNEGKELTSIHLPEFADEFAITTSGTTLKQKICIYTGREVCGQLSNTKQAIERNPDINRRYKGKMKILVVLPLYHIFGLEASYFWLTFLGAVTVFSENSLPKNILNTVRTLKVTHIFAVPLLFKGIEKNINDRLSQVGEKQKQKFNQAAKKSLGLQNISPKIGLAAAKAMFKNVRKNLLGDSVLFCISGGAYIEASTLELFAALGYPLYNGYGMSEIGISSVDFSPKIADRLPPAIGHPFGTVDFVKSEDGRLLVKGDSVCKKIYIDGKLTATDGFFDTGDIVEIDENGKYHLLGRISDTVLGEDGENLNPDIAERYFDLKTEFTVTGDAENRNLILIARLPDGIPEEQKLKIKEDIDRCSAALPSSYRIKKVYYTYDPLVGKGEIKISRARIRRDVAEGKIRLTEM